VCTCVQFAGTAHHIALGWSHGKKVVRVYDYVDSAVPVLARMFEKRLRGYRAIGYELADETTRIGDVLDEAAGF